MYSAPASSDSGELTDGMRPEFKEAMDSYEEFINEYCDFMLEYAQTDGTDAGMLADYTKFIGKYAEVAAAFDAWESNEMNAAETAYYIEVEARTAKRLLEVAE